MDNFAGIRLLQQYTGWRTTWKQIIPGPFGGSGLTDLLFYGASAGTGEFYVCTGPDQIQLRATHTNWRTT